MISFLPGLSFVLNIIEVCSNNVFHYLSDNIWLVSVWMCNKYLKSNPTFKLSNNFRQT